MTNSVRASLGAAAVVGLAIVAVPAIFALSNTSVSVVRVLFQADWRLPLLRSTSYAVINALIAVGCGFILAAHSAVHGATPRTVLPFLVNPLVGGVVVAFSFKLFIFRGHSAFQFLASRSALAWLAISVVEQWILLPLCAFFFILAMHHRHEGEETLLRLGSASFGAMVRDLYWPQCRDVTSLLLLFCVAVGLQEFTIPQVLLRASAGTSLELAGARLERFYFEWNNVDAVYAQAAVLQLAAMTALVFGFIAACFTLAATHVGQSVVKVIGRLTERQNVPFTGRSWLAPAVAAGLALLPAALIFRTAPRLSADVVNSVVTALMLVVVASILAMLLSIAVAAGVRVGWPQAMAEFSHRNLSLFVALIVPRFFPPIAIVVGLYTLVSVSGASDKPVLVWVLAQVLLLAPLLVIFLIVTNFAVPTAELITLKIARAGFGEVLKNSFITRLAREYAVVGTFAFALIMSEDAISSVMAYRVPSIAQILAMEAAGRAGTFDSALAVFLIPYCLVGVILLTLWSVPVRFAGSNP